MAETAKEVKAFTCSLVVTALKNLNYFKGLFYSIVLPCLSKRILFPFKPTLALPFLNANALLYCIGIITLPVLSIYPYLRSLSGVSRKPTAANPSENFCKPIYFVSMITFPVLSIKKGFMTNIIISCPYTG